MLTTLNILVVDDEPDITELVANILIDEGYMVCIAHDGASALDSIYLRPPDLVILDISMPVMGGDDLLYELRANGFARLPVIVATAGMHPERFLNHGATAILPKPFDLDQLLTTVDQCMYQTAA